METSKMQSQAKSVQLVTSLKEIYSFNPCVSGWKNILQARRNSTAPRDADTFSITSCLESNSVADVCWLIGKRKNKKELQILVKFAADCANSAKRMKLKRTAAYAAAYAAYAATDAATYAAADTTDAADAATDATDAADAAYADAAAYAATDAADAATDAAADAYAAADAATATDAATYARRKQQDKNKAFLIARIEEYEATFGNKS